MSVLASSTTFFEVDRRGLAQILERRGKAFVVGELWQNARDEAVSEVHILLMHVARGKAMLRIEDDSPDGWRDLRDAFTLFAPSYKKDDPTKAGRFNLGEKLVLALCDEASIHTTTGTIVFDENGRRHYPRRKRDRGSTFEGTVRMTKQDVADGIKLAHSLLVPDTIRLTVNGDEVPKRRPLATVAATLPTEIADGDGNLKPTRRLTEIEIFEPLDGETPMLYELGIPVIETGDRWHANVQQKVPVSLDRAGLVTPGYLRDVRAIVLNEMADRLGDDDAAEKWVDDALEDETIDPAAVTAVLTARYGEHRVVYDPSDPEANRIAAAKGYRVIHGAAFSRQAWDNIRGAAAALPAGQVTPSPQPFAADAPPLATIPPDSYPEVVEYIGHFSEAVLGRRVRVTLADDRGWGFAASYGRQDGLVWNVAKAPMKVRDREMDDLLIHEFAHEWGSHLSDDYDRALSRVGARAVQAAREGRL